MIGSPLRSDRLLPKTDENSKKFSMSSRELKLDSIASSKHDYV